MKNATILITMVALLLGALPAYAHIPAGWVPIEECPKHVGGAVSDAGTGGRGTDFSEGFVYRAMSDALNNLWKGEAPERRHIMIISKLPTTDAEQVIRLIIGKPVGEVPPGWRSRNPGKYEIKAPDGTDRENLKPENFEFTFIDTRNNKKYVWRAEEEIPGIFPEGYFELRNKKAAGKKLKWWEEKDLARMESRISSKLTESIGKRLSIELHDRYAHPLDEFIIGKEEDEGTMLYLAAELAESGDKEELGILREKFENASEHINGAHELIHGTIVPVAEDMGKGELEMGALHTLAHKLMASIYRIGEYLTDIEKTDDADEVKEKAGEMLKELRGLKRLSSELHIHSTDPATVLTGQKPLKLRNGMEVVRIKHEDIKTYLSRMNIKDEPAPVGGAIAFGVLVIGIGAVVLWRYRKR